MKHQLTSIIVALFLASTAPVRVDGSRPKQDLRVLNICELVNNWKNYNRHKVRMRGIYEVGAEQAWLYDPACKNGEALTDVSFEEHVKGATKKLDQIVANDRRAWVTLEGVFYGPEPFDQIDPKLPVSIREKLQKSHKGTDTWVHSTR